MRLDHLVRLLACGVVAAIPDQSGASGDLSTAADKLEHTGQRLSGDASKEEYGDLMAPLLLEAMGGRCFGPDEASDVLHLHQAYASMSNLNGVGHGDTPEENECCETCPLCELYLGNVATSKTGLRIDAIVTASDTYQSAKPSKNTIVDGFFQVNMKATMAGATGANAAKGDFGRTQAEFSFRFIEAVSQEDYVMEDILFSFYDLDQGIDNTYTECLAWDANSLLVTTATTQLAGGPLAAPIEAHYTQHDHEHDAAGMVEYCSTTQGTGKDNPKDPKSINQMMADRTGLVIGKDVNTFRVTFSIAFGGYVNGRNLMMSIDNPIQPCPEPPVPPPLPHPPPPPPCPSPLPSAPHPPHPPEPAHPPSPPPSPAPSPPPSPPYSPPPEVPIGPYCHFDYIQGANAAQGLMPDAAPYTGTWDYLEPRVDCPAYYEMMFYCCNPFRTTPACDPAEAGCNSPNPIGRESVCMEYYVNATDCGGPKNSYHIMDMCCDYEWRCGPSQMGWCGFGNNHGHGTHNHGKTREEIAEYEAAEEKASAEEKAKLAASEAELEAELAAAEKRMHQRHEERVRRAEEREAKEDPADHERDPAKGFGSWSRSRIASFFHLFAR